MQAEVDYKRIERAIHYGFHQIPFGELVSCQSVSEQVDNPQGLQATGGAIGKNPVAFLIPCHRMVRMTEEINGSRWGLNRKSALIVWKAAHR